MKKVLNAKEIGERLVKLRGTTPREAVAKAIELVFQQFLCMKRVNGFQEMQ